MPKVITDEYIKNLLPKRSKDHHKGLSGTAALYIGSKGYAGAAVIAAKSAVKSGVGIANIILPEDIYPIVCTSIPEAICTLLSPIQKNEINCEDTEKTIRTINNSTAALIGCGLGQSEQVKNTVTKILKKCNTPLVIDADGINVLANSIELIADYKCDKVFTPHPKEASRLLKCSVDEIQKNRETSAIKLSKMLKSTVILKGYNTIISTDSGENYVVLEGNPGMATAGTGDMLAGMVVAFIAQGVSPDNAAVLGAKLHAISGDIALKESSILSLTPSDMINVLPSVLNKFYMN